MHLYDHIATGLHRMQGGVHVLSHVVDGTLALANGQNSVRELDQILQDMRAALPDLAYQTVTAHCALSDRQVWAPFLARGAILGVPAHRVQALQAILGGDYIGASTHQVADLMVNHAMQVVVLVPPPGAAVQWWWAFCNELHRRSIPFPTYTVDLVDDLGEHTDAHPGR